MNRGIPILLYHRVGDRDGSFMDEFTVSPGRFAEQMDWIGRNGWRPIVLESVVDGSGSERGKRSLVLTFDDGFASNREHAWPILKKHGFPSATFVVTDRLGAHNSWDGPSRASYPLLSAEDLDSAEAGPMTFHSHSATHADLRDLKQDLEGLGRELEHSRRRLAGVATAGLFFAYPWGAWNREVVQQVAKAGYVGACTCIEGLNSPKTNPYLLRRVEIRECDVGWRLWLKVHFGRDLLNWPRRQPLTFSRLAARLRRGRHPRPEAA